MSEHTVWHDAKYKYPLSDGVYAVIEYVDLDTARESEASWIGKYEIWTPVGETGSVNVLYWRGGE